MGRVVIIDANVVDHLSRGNKLAADALKKLIQSGDTVYVSQRAYAELTSQPGKMVAGVGPDLPRTAAANKKLLQDLGIRVAPPAHLSDRVAVYDRNSAAKVLSLDDAMTAAQARALNAEVWSFDKSFRKPTGVTNALGVRIARESQTAYVSPGKVWDYRTARALMGLPKVNISVGGVLLKPPGPPPSSGGPAGTKGGAGGPAGTKAVLGMPDKGPVDFGPTSSRGEKIGNAVQLALGGLNFLIQAINDAKQADRLKEAWERVRPQIERRLAADPSIGVLILIRFGRRPKQGPEHDSPLEHLNQFLSVDFEYGLTESEAWETYTLKPRITGDVGLDISVQRTFVPPRNPIDVRRLRTPFASYGVATFVPGKESLMRVAWKGVFGFDEIGDIDLAFPGDARARFLLLLAPSTITWLNGLARHATDVPVEWRDAGSAAARVTRSVAVVDMDRGLFNVGSDKAAMVFPADETTTRLLADGETKDNTAQLRVYLNFERVRWVRPQNIHVLRKFDEESDSRAERAPPSTTR